VLDQLVSSAREGRSRVLVMRGEAGVGKTVLLDHLAETATDCCIARAAGVESEMELGFAGLHQLCAPFVDRLDHLPGPQRASLETAFGLSRGEPPDQFLVGLAVLSLLSEVAEEKPLVCLVDDVQWLDQVSAQTLAFLARRLLAEGMAVVLTVREPNELTVLEGLPDMPIEGLRDGAARALLASVITGPMDAQVRDRIIHETAGNPLALVEMTRGLTPAALAGGFGLPETMPLTSRIEAGFLRRVRELPSATRDLLLVAAAEPTGDAALLWLAAERLGIDPEALAASGTESLIEVGGRVRFRHPLVRSAAYRAGTPTEAARAHRALADVSDPELDPDRRAWHLAQAANGPDETVAGALERSADRAQSRGGLAAAAAFLERAAELTPGKARRAQRALAAAQAKHQAGDPEASIGMLAMAEAGPLDELGRARADLLLGQIAFGSQHGRDAPPLLLKAAGRLEPLDIGLARETYLDAFIAGLFVGRLSPVVMEVSTAARQAASAPGPPRAADLLLDGLSLLVTEGYAVGAPPLRLALDAFRGDEISSAEGLRWLWLAGRVAMALWEDEIWHELASRHVQLTRDAGALGMLPLALRGRILVHVYAGELGEGAALIEEAQSVAAATNSRLGPYGDISIAAWRGQEAEAAELIATTMAAVESRGEGLGMTSQFTAALLYNGLGRYAEAFTAAKLACEYDDLGTYGWALTELVEAAARCEQPAAAVEALERLTETTQASGTEWALGIEARSRAQVSEGEVAEGLYRESIERLGRTRIPPALARGHLLYGEWLRRANRRVDAREQLRLAHELFEGMGAEAFAERARRELGATGEKVRKRTVETRDQLTAQEGQIARLAREGRTNPEIGAQLFISPRTVEWHLRKVFAKLGIRSRKELAVALPEAGPVAAPL
jgi:DNA-binding CsgD family transcriptional regulator